ncbi:hypothetical protein GW17_00026527 [Ensete ventricosum]|nr:hypothetical protein GW17_00026527 [Ensete ventricosum]
MLPLRFLNNGIRAKAGRRRGGQPRPTPMHGRPPTARPRLRPPTRGRSVARMHGQLRPACRGGSRLQRGARKGLLPWPALPPVGATTPVVGAAASGQGQPPPA